MNWLARISSFIQKLFLPQGLCSDSFLFFGVPFPPQISRRLLPFLGTLPQMPPLLRSQYLPFHLKSLTLPLFSMSLPCFFSQSPYQSSVLHLYYLFLCLIIVFFSNWIWVSRKRRTFFLVSTALSEWFLEECLEPSRSSVHVAEGGMNEWVREWDNLRSFQMVFLLLSFGN